MLEQEIKSDIEERQKLLLQIKTLHFRYGFNEKDEQVFLNYSIPIIYAIWEGFVQSVFRIYIEKINNLNLTVDTICKPILTHHLENKFKQFREYPKDTNKKVLFFDGLDQFYTNRIIDINAVVNTESNVGFNVINRLLKTFNLTELPEYPEPKYSLSQELKKLLKIRNSVAHGQDSIIVNREDLENSIKLVEILMDLVFESIVNGFESKSYLHTT
jgi:hypothetical protein